MSEECSPVLLSEEQFNWLLDWLDFSGETASELKALRALVKETRGQADDE